MIELPTESEPARVIEGEALAVLPSLPDGVFDAVITDPPYSSGGAFRGDRMGGTMMKYTMSDGRRDIPDFEGDNRDQRAYGYWSALWLDQCRRVTKPGGVCCIFTDWRQIATTIDAIQAGGWMFRGVVPWDKTEAARPTKGRFRNQCEYVVWGSRGPMADSGECHPGLFRKAVAGMDKEHTAQKPVEVMRGLVRITPAGFQCERCGGIGQQEECRWDGKAYAAPAGRCDHCEGEGRTGVGLILDPFAGSGTTGVAAMLEGRRAVLIEREEPFLVIARRRVAEAMGSGLLAGLA